MKFITAIVVIALSDMAACSQAFNGHTVFVRATNTDPARSRVQRAIASALPANVKTQNIGEKMQRIHQRGTRKFRQQDLNTYWPFFSTQRPPKKFRRFQTATNSEQNDVTSYLVQQSTSFYTSPEISSPASRQPSSTPYSTLRPNSQQSSSTYAPRSYRGSKTYSPRPNLLSYSRAGSSAFLPQNFPKPFRSVSKTGKRRSLTEGVDPISGIGETSNKLASNGMIPPPPPPPETASRTSKPPNMTALMNEFEQKKAEQIYCPHTTEKFKMHNNDN